MALTKIVFEELHRMSGNELEARLGWLDSVREELETRLSAVADRRHDYNACFASDVSDLAARHGAEMYKLQCEEAEIKTRLRDCDEFRSHGQFKMRAAQQQLQQLQAASQQQPAVLSLPPQLQPLQHVAQIADAATEKKKPAGDKKPRTVKPKAPADPLAAPATAAAADGTTPSKPAVKRPAPAPAATASTTPDNAEKKQKMNELAASCAAIAAHHGDDSDDGRLSPLSNCGRNNICD
jgi:chemotaxis protein histidine kinase CheA